MAEVAAVLDEDRPQETPAEVADLDPGDPALIVFTSGTTGEPRGAVHAQRYLPGQRAQAEHWLGARDGRARLGARPRPAGRSRRATSSSPPGSAARRR